MATQTTIKKLPPIKEDVGAMKMRIQELEKEVAQYKNRLEELRKAKNNLIIKKTTEYVKTGMPALGTQREKADTSPTNNNANNDNYGGINAQYNEDVENLAENLNNELMESRSLIVALRLENEELRGEMENIKKSYSAQLSELMGKNEEYKKEIANWEVMYKDWMKMMEDRVSNINRTNQILQQCINPPNEETEPEEKRE